MGTALQRFVLGSFFLSEGSAASLLDDSSMRRAKIIAAFTCLIVLAGQSFTEEHWGRFKGEVIAKFLSDGRNMRLEQPFGYVDPHGRAWDVPAGMTTDGASVPRFFWMLFPPFTGKYRSAAVIHDYYCQTRSRDWRDTHEVFYNAMRAAGVDETTAKAMYAAVYTFGPRWGIGARPRGPGADKYRTDEQQQAFFHDLQEWIQRENPSLTEIKAQLDQDVQVPPRK